MDWERLTEKLILKDGIFFAQVSPEVSYPSEANDAYFAIEDESFWFKHRANCISEVIKNFPADGLVFDIGGGNGHVASVLEKNGFATVLVEPGLPGVLNAQRRGLKNLICATIESAGLPKGTLSAIGLFDVLEHIQEDKKFLISIREALKPDGMLYLTVPAYQDLWSQEDEYAGHFRRYSCKALKKQLESVGFEVNYMTYLFSFLPFFILIFRRFPYVFGFGQAVFDKEPAKGHIIQNKFLKTVFDRIFQSEINSIKDKRTMGFGSTCLIAARIIK